MLNGLGGLLGLLVLIIILRWLLSDEAGALASEILIDLLTLLRDLVNEL